MADSTTIDERAHPAPYRHHVSLLGLVVAMFAPPLAWSAHLIVNYIAASRACYPDGAMQTAPSFHWLWLLLVVIDIVSLVISAAATAAAYRSWQASVDEMAEHAPPIVETGEGRTRFLAIWGLLIGVGFFVAVVFDFVGLWILPICS